MQAVVGVDVVDPECGSWWTADRVVEDECGVAIVEAYVIWQGEIDIEDNKFWCEVVGIVVSWIVDEIKCGCITSHKIWQIYEYIDIIIFGWEGE